MSQMSPTRNTRRRAGLLPISLMSIFAALPVAAEHPNQSALVDRAVSEYGLDRGEVEALLAQSEYKQSIIDAITRPAEAMPWYRYRKIFLTDERINAGVDFWNENQALITRASEHFAVDPEIIVAIIGVETFYGRITGSYKVIDALATLGFYYDRRADFFSKELLEYMQLGQEEQLPIAELQGSYAGAMGLGQFMPSSYRAYAVDFDEDGQRDLWESKADIIGSVANYFQRHRWHDGEAVVVRLVEADNAPDLSGLKSMSSDPESTLAGIAALGFEMPSGLDPATPASLQVYESEDGMEYWASLHNFYVITRYNRSPLYALAVYQLSREIAAAHGDGA